MANKNVKTGSVVLFTIPNSKNQVAGRITKILPNREYSIYSAKVKKNNGVLTIKDGDITKVLSENLETQIKKLIKEEMIGQLEFDLAQKYLDNFSKMMDQLFNKIKLLKDKNNVKQASQLANKTKNNIQTLWSNIDEFDIIFMREMR